MELSIHPQAKTAFDERVNDLKLRLKTLPERFKSKKQKENPNVHVETTLTASDIIGEIEPHWSVMGKTTAQAFDAGDGRTIGLFGEDHIELTKIAEGLQKAIEPRNVIGTK